MRKQKQPQRISTPPPTKVPEQSPNITSSLFSGILQGFSFGTGSSIAHNLFRSPLVVSDTNTSKQTAACDILQKQYFEMCQISPVMGASKCQSLYDDMTRICNDESSQNPKPKASYKEVW